MTSLANKPMSVINFSSEAKEKNKNDDFNDSIKNIFKNKKITKILLISPPDVPKELFSWETCSRGRYSNYPPYGLLALASQIRSRGVSVRVINLNNEVLRSAKLNNFEDFNFHESWKAPLTKELEDFKPDMVGLTCMFSQTHDSLRDVVCAIKEYDLKIPIGVGGVHITNSFTNEATKKNVLQSLKGVELFFLYEADLSFPIFVDVVNGECGLENLGQFALRKSDTECIEINKRLVPTESILDTIPAHDLLPPKETSMWGPVGAYTFLKSPNTIYANVLSNRGCRAMCTFCSVRGFNGTGVRRRSVESVVDELKLLVNEFGVQHIMWLDDDFFYDHPQTIKLFDSILKAGLKFTWDCTNGVLAASCTEEIVAAAADSGCIGLNIGMESGNSRILKQIKKPASVPTLLKAAKILVKEPRIFSRVFLMIGFPGETYGEVKDTFDVAKEMSLDWYQIQVLQPLPNTPIYKQMVAEGYITDTNFSEIRYSGGTYGRMAKRNEQGKDVLEEDFDKVFLSNDLALPISPNDYEKAWGYMTYHLNYEPILRKANGIKANQLKAYLSHVSKVIAPNDPFAIYYSLKIDGQLELPKDKENISRLEAIFKKSNNWENKFKELKLTPLSELKGNK